MTNGDSLSIENCVVSNFGAGNGVHINTPAKVRIFDTVVRNNGIGILVQGGAKAAVASSKILANPTSGIHVYSQSNPFTEVSINDSLISHNGSGVHVYETNASTLNRVAVFRSTISHNTLFGVASEFNGGPTVVSVSESLLMNNTTGFAQIGAGATLESFGNNTLRANGGDTGTVTTVSVR
jgi:hypothetical protein